MPNVFTVLLNKFRRNKGDATQPVAPASAPQEITQEPEMTGDQIAEMMLNSCSIGWRYEAMAKHPIPKSGFWDSFF